MWWKKEIKEEVVEVKKEKPKMVFVLNSLNGTIYEPDKRPSVIDPDPERYMVGEVITFTCEYYMSFKFKVIDFEFNRETNTISVIVETIEYLNPNLVDIIFSGSLDGDDEEDE